jgi:membrane-associated protease RseP (regulator of RpoE activity)
MARSNLQYFLQSPGRKTPAWVFALLFGATFFTCSIAGSQWLGLDYTVPSNWLYGVEYALLILAFLTAHEFGHYLAARYHEVDVTLPFYIPFPFTFMLNYGTFGAVIRTREKIPTKKALFDIGIAGPIAGFLVCVIYLVIGFSLLPDKYMIYHEPPRFELVYGETLLFSILYAIFSDSHLYLPAMNQIQAFPYLNVAWFGLFVTTLNLLPIGQLDGGHISYAMFGKYQEKIAKYAWWVLAAIGFGALAGVVHDLLEFRFESEFMIKLRDMLYPPLHYLDVKFPFLMNGWFGWLLWGIILRLFVRLGHPPVGDDVQLGTGRRILGWSAFAILLLSFSYRGIYLVQ